MDRARSSRLLVGVVVVTVVVRVAVWVALVWGPWTDEPADLEGWDVERFAEIVAADGRPWRDHEVEYPPGSVAVFEALGGDVTELSDRIAVVAGLADLALVGLLWRRWSPSSAVAYLALSTPLIALGYQRLDLLAAALALAGLAAARRGLASVVGIALVAGTAVKLFPVVLLPGFVLAAPPERRLRVLGVSTLMGACAVGAWLAYGGLDAPAQVLGFRGADGIHIESVPGQVWHLFSPSPSRLEAGSYRFGSPPRALTSAATALGFVAIAAVWSKAFALERGAPALSAEPLRPGADREGIVIAGCGAALVSLLLSSALFSPQFMQWLSPVGALLATQGRRAPGLGPRRADSATVTFSANNPTAQGTPAQGTPAHRPTAPGNPAPRPPGPDAAALVFSALFGATILTAGTHWVWTPAGLDATAPQLALAVRSTLLGTVLVMFLRRPALVESEQLQSG